MAQDLNKIVASAVEAVGYELVLLEMEARRGGMLLRVFIDGPRGIAVEDCARASRQIEGVLTVEEAVSGDYTLEVSSPGLDRPLVTPAHFQRFVGEQVKVKSWAAHAGQRNLRGRLLDADAEAIKLGLDGDSVLIPYSDIKSARLVPEL
ncbi:MAG: ribosome maturation factor RimP [Gammaproteobacteria bacterium]|nr:ribosome maturation factor RimP [Gammaproteobacteria bacterium]